MPIPDFIVALRSKIGHDLLWLPSVTAVVFDADGRVLLVRRSDNGAWTLVTGCTDPGEQPADAAIREVFEETGVRAVPEALIGVEATPPGVCANGDRVQWMDVAFRCRHVDGEARVNDDESVDVAWFDPADAPSLGPRQTRQLATALEGGDRAHFQFDGEAHTPTPAV
ncbi:NUDIX hydrolase [Stackebrandtia soli]|uniref:NUDIX hydrolase n=1 Tax=Stackebrandtia soli TaxID=1892856 RepID=UPI0039EC3FC4